MATTPPRSFAYRVALSRKGRTMKLDSATRLEMIALPSISIVGMQAETGSWFTLEDRQGRTLYRRPVEGPAGALHGVPGGTDREFMVVQLPPSDRIELLLPDLPDADALVFHASDTRGALAHGPARPLARLSMKQVADLARRQSRDADAGGDHGRQ